MQLFVKGLQTSVLDVAETDRVIDVKERLANSDGIPCDDQVLTFAGRPLDDEETLVSYGITDLSTLSVDVRLLGGKFMVYFLFRAKCLSFVTLYPLFTNCISESC